MLQLRKINGKEIYRDRFSICEVVRKIHYINKMNVYILYKDG